MATALVVALALLALPATMFVLQDRLLYFPEPAPLERMASGGLRAWPSSDDFRGLVSPADGDAHARATAVVFHGNAGHAGHRAWYAQALDGIGLRVILAEYPGYGPRSGKPGEAALVDDAEATLALAHRHYGDPLLVVGESLGAAVAAGVAARRPELITGLLLVTPWDRLANVASHHYPWLPVRWLLNDRYDSVEALRTYARPIVVAVAENDTIVPARFGIALHDSLDAPKRLVFIPASGHNDWPTHVDAHWWEEAVRFALGDEDGGRGSEPLVGRQSLRR